MMPALDCLGHALEQISVVLVAIRLQVEICGDFGEAFVANIFDVCLHEIIVVVPVDSTGKNGRLFDTGRNLMGVQVVEIEPVDHGFLHFFMQDEEAVCFDCPAVVLCQYGSARREAYSGLLEGPAQARLPWDGWLSRSFVRRGRLCRRGRGQRRARGSVKEFAPAVAFFKNLQKNHPIVPK